MVGTCVFTGVGTRLSVFKRVETLRKTAFITTQPPPTTVSSIWFFARLVRFSCVMSSSYPPCPAAPCLLPPAPLGVSRAPAPWLMS
jgi:hypothetical protein